MFRRRWSTDNLFVLPHWQPFLTIDGDSAATGGSALPATNGVATATANSDGSTINGVPATNANGNVDWGQFNAGLASLGDTLATRLDALRGDVHNLPDNMRPPPTEPPPPNYDEMTQADLAAHITGSVMKAFEAKITEMLGPINAQIQNVQQSAATREVTSEVAAMRTEHRDFNDWKDEMVGLARQHPTLGIKQLYNLARVDNPTKAGELDKRYNPTPPPPPKWGGLTPAALSGNSGQPPVSRAQAGTDAYREVAARHPGVLAALESM